MSTNNAFLQADIVTTDLASESTLKQIETELVSGTLEVDFPASALLNVAIDENDISGNVPIRIDANDVSGNIPVNVVSNVITDIDFTTTQTDDVNVNVTNTILDVSANVTNLVDCSCNLKSEAIKNDYNYLHTDNRYYIFNEHHANLNSANFAAQSGSIVAYKGWNVTSGGLDTVEKEIIQGAKYIVFECTAATSSLGASSDCTHELHLISEPTSVDRLTRELRIQWENSSLEIRTIITEENGSTYEQIVDKADFIYDKFDGNGPSGFIVGGAVANRKFSFRIIADNHGSGNFQIWVPEAQKYITFHSLNYLEHSTSPNNYYTLMGNYVSVGFRDTGVSSFWVDRFSVYLTDDDTNLDLPIIRAKPQMTDAMNAFNEFRVNELEPLFQYNFRYNFNDRLFITKTSGSPNATVTSSYPDVRAYTLQGGARYSVITSIIPCHYRNGQEAVLRCTVRNQNKPNPTSTKLSYNFWGFGDRCDDGATTIPRNFIGFTYNGFDGLCVAIKSDDDTPSAFSTLYLPETQWNRRHNLLMNIDYDDMNLFELRFIYLGQKGVQFRIYDTAQNKMVTVHEYIHGNQFNTPFVDNPILSFCMGSTNDATSNENGDVRAHSIMLAIQGKNVNHFPERAINTNSGSQGNGTDILLLECRNQYETYDNYDRFFIKSITASATNSGNNSTSLLFYKNTSYSVAPVPANLDANNSIIAYSALGEAVGTFGTVSSLGVLVYSISLSSGGGSVSIEDLNKIYLEPNATINVRINTTGGSNSTVDLSVILEEDM